MSGETPVVWVTRTAEGAAATAHAITALGFEAVIAPVLQAVSLPADLDAVRFDQVIFTGRNGLNAFCRLSSRRDVTAWCIGGATAEAARAEGFADVQNAEGDAEALFKRIQTRAPRNGLFLYPAPREPAAPLTAWMWAEGLSISQVTLYETMIVMPDLTPDDATRLTHVLIQSAKAARAVASAIASGKFAFIKLCLIFISDAASRAFDEALAAACQNKLTEAITRRISPFPDQASMLKLIETP